MKHLMIETESKNYPVYIGDGAITMLPKYLESVKQSISNIWVIADETVAGHYLEILKNTLSPVDVPVHITLVPAGENAKTFREYERCLGEGLMAEANRKTVILALGGGATGDLAGFVAASFMRGIRYIQIPTTLLAHDSAVGGKTAINHELGKNMVGAFHQPEAIFYDTRFLRTLSAKEWRSGYAEAVKHALIQQPDLYDWMLKKIDNLEDLQEDCLSHIIVHGIQVKAAIVREDERESGIREYLNFGHTLGHAIEAELGYGRITHGEAVMIGMVFALSLSMELKGLEFNQKEFREYVEKLGYSLEMPVDDYQALIKIMKKDKKTTGNRIRFILLERIGKPATVELSEKELLAYMHKYLSIQEGKDD